MKIAALALVGTLLASPVVAERQERPMHPSDAPEDSIVISCYRGPWKTVAWDRPNAVFIDTLMNFGYNSTQAHTIGERVCRDEYGVDDIGHMVATLNRLMAEQPPAN